MRKNKRRNLGKHPGHYKGKWKEAHRNAIETYNVVMRKIHNIESYGLSMKEYYSLKLRQKNACAICKENLPLVIDHSHATEKVRGLLCHACNQSLGKLKENVQTFLNAVRYLRKHR